MKNLLIYINPSKKFFGEGQNKSRDNTTLVKIQIDNSLDLGWKKEDILLFTNFDYKYNGIKSTVIDDSSYCDFRPLSTKTTTINYLFEKGFIGPPSGEAGNLYWAHDFDAFQNSTITESEIKLSIQDIGLTDYGWQSKLCLGSYFFKDRAKDIFKKLKETIYEIKNEDERAFNLMVYRNDVNIRERFKKLNITYDFGMRHVEDNFAKAEKPLKVLHFHPYYRDTKMPRSTLDLFMYGKNGLKMPLMSERLIKIFKHHGIK